MKTITEFMLDRLSREAADCQRKRRNFNLHVSYQDPCQRLFNAVEPGSYVRPHRHLEPSRWEAFVAVRGRLAVMVFDDSGVISQVAVIAPNSSAVGVQVEAGQWHSILSLESGSIFFEVKPGPYEPVSDKDWATWSPAEESPDAARFLTDLDRRVRQILAET